MDPSKFELGTPTLLGPSLIVLYLMQAERLGLRRIIAELPLPQAHSNNPTEYQPRFLLIGRRWETSCSAHTWRLRQLGL